MAKLRPAFGWVGGKATKVYRLLPYVCRHQTYVEPFGGAAALLHAKEPSPVEVYNDVDHGLVDFFRILRNPKKFRELKRMLDVTIYSREEFYFCRDTWKTLKRGTVERIRRWFVIVRQSHAGWFGKAWGHVKFTSTRGMSTVCSSWLSAIDRLPEICERFRRVQVEQLDFSRILDKYDREDTFFYLDPPYIPVSRRIKKIYEYELSTKRHIDLISQIQKLQGKVMLTGYPSDTYSELDEASWLRVDFSHSVSTMGRTGQHKKAKVLERGGQKQIECIWLSPSLIGALKKEGSYGLEK